jgi:hypothetical protein
VNIMKNAAAIAALTFALTVASHAATPPPVPENLLACSKLADAGERTRCYDREIKAMSTAAASAAPAPSTPAVTAPAAAAAAAAAAATTPAPTPAVSPAPAKSAAAVAAPAAAAAATPAPSTAPGHFGEELLPPTSRPEPNPKDQVLTSSITAMKEVRPKLFIISLANGQVWRQEGTQITMFFRVGDDVRIERHVLGAYHMSTSQTGEKNWVRVTRVQ